MKTIVLLSLSAALLGSTALHAQANPMAGTQRFSGTIESVDGATFRVKSPEAGSVALRLLPDTRVSVRQRVSLSEVGPNTYIGCTAVQQASGELHATECHIFPDDMRGRGDGHNPMGPPATTMTNGNVTTMTNGSVSSAAGSKGEAVLKIAYKDGAKDIRVTPQTEITRVVGGDVGMLKPGTRVMGGARPAADGGAEVVMMNVLR